MTRIAGQEQLPWLHIDSGGLLFKQSRLSAGQEEAGKNAAAGIAEAMQTMNCRALGIAAHDLAGGVAFLKRLQQERQLAWLSMNLVEAGSRQPVFPSWLMTEIAGLPVAVLGLTGGPAMLDAAPDKADYAVLPWQDVLPETLKQAGGKAAMVILLSSYPDAVNKEIAAAYPGLHIVLASGPGAAASHPSLVGGTLFAQTGAQGKTFGLLRITWTEAGKWAAPQAAEENLCRFNARLIPLESSLPEDAAVREIIRRAALRQTAGKKRRGD